MSETSHAAPCLGLAVEALGRVIGLISALPEEASGTAHRDAVHSTKVEAESAVHGVLMNLLVYRNGHGLAQHDDPDATGNQR